MELEKDVDKVMKNTEERLGLLTEAIELVTDKLSVMDRLEIVPVRPILCHGTCDWPL